MSYQVDELLVPGWRNVSVDLGLFTNTFIFPISSHDKLPPEVYCDVLRAAGSIISRNYSFASIWIQVDSPGLWYPIEIRRGLSTLRVPVAVTRSRASLHLADFNFKPYTSGHKLPPPVYEADWISPVSQNELDCLRVLARLQQGLTSEIASLVGVSKRTAQYALGELWTRGFIEHVNPFEDKTIQTLYSRKYSYWAIRRSGLKVALRSWGIPPGTYVSSRLEAAHGLGEVSRHKTVARLWLAWLKKSLGQRIEIWDGWTEVNLTDMRLTPDALAWAKYEGLETLFWLEVESGHDAGTKTLEKTYKRLQAASKYAYEREIRLVFALLTRPWLQNAITGSVISMGLPRHVAMIIGDWTAFGKLPDIEWGRLRKIEDPM